MKTNYRSIQISFDEALKKAQNYCAYQERCIEDVRIKLLAWELEKDQIGEIIKKLEKDNFLSDERFTELYVRSKINQKKWGKLKIYAGLKSKNISNETISDHMAKIDVETYKKNILFLIDDKLKKVEVLEPFLKKQKVIHYMRSKGYEVGIVNEIFKKAII